MESLCRRPDPERLAGPGYDAVPKMRQRVLAGGPTPEDALAGLRTATGAFEVAVLDWCKAHTTSPWRRP